MNNTTQMQYPVYQPLFAGNEKKYVNECLDSTWVSSKGQFIQEFESSFASYTEAEHAVGVCNGTVALHLSLIAIGINQGDEVIVPTFTYVASVNTIVQAGGIPVFVDIDRETWQMNPLDIEQKITPKTKAIMVVHLYGHSCDMDKIMQIALKYNLLVIEDCAEAIGTKYKGKHVGNFGDAGAFSFFGNKTITCGEGGMVVTNNAAICDKLIHLKGQGLARGREYWHDIIGFNYRMTNIQAAIGLAQLEQIESFLIKKQQIANWYNNNLTELPIKFHGPSKDVDHSFWMCSILVETPELRINLRNHLKNVGIDTRPTFFPVHTMPMYYKEGVKYQNAEYLSIRGINLPSYPGLSKEDVDFICKEIKQGLKNVI